MFDYNGLIMVLGIKQDQFLISWIVFGMQLFSFTPTALFEPQCITQNGSGWWEVARQADIKASRRFNYTVNWVCKKKRYLFYHI